ncbi:hypothetical protein ACHQM5_027098 [Ranunculus cassubicifolius]
MNVEETDPAETNIEDAKVEVIDGENEEQIEQGKLLPPPEKKFQNREELLAFVHYFSLLQGYITTIRDSKKEQYVTLGCDRGGSYRNRTKTPTEERKRTTTSSRLINCPFQIKGAKLVDGSWVLRIKSGAHNHEISTDMFGHPSFHYFSREEIIRIKEMSKSGMPPRKILTSLRQGNSDLGPKEELIDGETERKKKRKEDSSKDTKIPTVSIAVPGSITKNAQSLELATRLAGQIARAATIFGVDEIIVFDDKNITKGDSSTKIVEKADIEERGAPFLMRILKYLETPPYLRSCFPMHNSLRCVGVLSQLDAPHHLRKHEWCLYREGITLKEKTSDSKGTLVNVGLDKNVVIHETLEPGIRVTVSMGADQNQEMESPRRVVASSTPREEGGLCWGYKVRYASNLSSVFRHCPYKGGYDHTIGTSEHGLTLQSSELSIPMFRHLLIAFGGLDGLEKSIEEDNSLKGKDARQVFHSYLNTCPNQKTRTIQTEEAVLISLQYLQEPISRALSSLKMEATGFC